MRNSLSFRLHFLPTIITCGSTGSSVLRRQRKQNAITVYARVREKQICLARICKPCRRYGLGGSGTRLSIRESRLLGKLRRFMFEGGHGGTRDGSNTESPNETRRQGNHSARQTLLGHTDAGERLSESLLPQYASSSKMRRTNEGKTEFRADYSGM